jgi:3-oxoacyl-(acyl-carrier-protein) synthase
MIHVGESIVVTGMGVFAAPGLDLKSFWSAIRSGRGGIRRIRRFDTSGYSSNCAGEIEPGWEDPIASAVVEHRTLDRCSAYALVAAREAWSQASVPGALPRGRIAVVVGTSAGGARSFDPTSPSTQPLADRGWDPAHHGSPAVEVAATLGVAGPRITVSAACASSNLPLAHGRDLLWSDQAILVLRRGSSVRTAVVACVDDRVGCCALLLGRNG